MDKEHQGMGIATELVDFAKKMKESLSPTNVLDLKENIEALYKQIKNWNKD